ncbi:ATP-binding domain-containing protein, partial [Mariniblastus sp.]|nr:ATP-binding domain-containing protein [Mariniblastus sp.]
SDDSFSAAVEQKVKSWLDGGVEPSGIAILTAKNIDSSYLSEFSASFRSKVVLLDEGNVGACDSIILSTIKDFKGLERSFVAITDLDDLEMVELFTPALYVGMTRANLGLWLAMSNEFKSELDGAIAKHALILAQDGGG